MQSFFHVDKIKRAFLGRFVCEYRIFSGVAYFGNDALDQGLANFT